MKPSRQTTIGSIAFVILALLGSTALLAQNQSPTKMVVLHVRVTDASSKAVVDVPQSVSELPKMVFHKRLKFFQRKRYR